MATDSLKMVCPMHYSDKIENSGVELRKIINWPKGPVKFLNNWPEKYRSTKRTDMKGGICPPPSQETKDRAI